MIALLVLQPLARGLLGFARGAVGLAGGLAGLAGRLQGGLGLGQAGLGGVERRAVVLRGVERLALGGAALGLAAALLQARLQLGQPTGQGGAASLQLGDFTSLLVLLGLGFGDGPAGGLERVAGVIQGLAVGAGIGVERRPFLGQAGDRRGGILGLSGGPLAVGLDLRQALLGLDPGCDRAGFLALQVLALDHQALQGGTGLGLGLAQRGQGRGGFALLRGGARRRLGQAGDPALSLAVPLPRLAQRGLGRGHVEMQEDRLVTADVVGQVPIAGRLAGLPLEALELGLEGRDDVVEALQVALGGAQAQLGLVPAGVQAGDPGGLLQQGPAPGRLGVDQRADPALADQRGRVRAGRRIGEQELDVLGAMLAAVDPVGRAAAALDLSGDLKLVQLGEVAAGGAVAVVQGERDLGQVARRARGAAGEDDVVHLAAAHALGRGLAHDPAQGLDEVGLAASVGADDPGQARRDDQLRRIDEGLKAGKPQLRELDQI